MRIISKYHKLNKHALHAKLKTASHRFAHVIDEDPDTHLTTLGETFNSLVTGAGLPNYNLLRFLQDQLANGLQTTDAVPQALEENKEYIDSLMNM